MGTLQLFNSAREKLLQSGRAEVSLVLDIVYFLGYSHWKPFNVSELVTAMRKADICTSTALIRRGLSDPLFYRSADSPTRGRPTHIYFAPSIDDVADALDVSIGVTDELDAEHFRNLREYRAGLHISFLARCPGQYSRAWLGDRLGVSARTTWHYEQSVSLFQVIVRESYNRSRITDWKEVPRERVSGSFLEVVRSPRTVLQSYHRMPLMQSIAQRELNKGSSVYVTFREANYYRVELISFDDDYGHVF